MELMGGGTTSSPHFQAPPTITHYCVKLYSMIAAHVACSYTNYTLWERPGNKTREMYAIVCFIGMQEPVFKAGYSGSLPLSDYFELLDHHYAVSPLPF